MVDHTVRIGADPTRVLAEMNDQDVVAELAASQYAARHTWTTDGLAVPYTDLSWSTDLSNVPALFRRWVGPTLDVRDVRRWRPTTAFEQGFETDLDVDVSSGARKATLTGLMTLVPTPEGTEVVLTGTVQLAGFPRPLVRVVQGKAERAVVELVLVHLNMVQRRLAPAA